MIEKECRRSEVVKRGVMMGNKREGMEREVGGRGKKVGGVAGWISARPRLSSAYEEHNQTCYIMRLVVVSARITRRHPKTSLPRALQEKTVGGLDVEIHHLVLAPHGTLHSSLNSYHS